MSQQGTSGIMAAVRVRRGQPRQSVKTTLACLGLTQINSCVLCTDKELGMLKKAKDYITYGEIDVSQLSQLLTNHSEENESDKRAKKLTEGEIELTKDLKGPYGLTPPSKGYKNGKLPYKRSGSLGYRGEDINLLLKRMV